MDSAHRLMAVNQQRKRRPLSAETPKRRAEARGQSRAAGRRRIEFMCIAFLPTNSTTASLYRSLDGNVNRDFPSIGLR